MRRNLTRREWLTAAGSASLLGIAGVAQGQSGSTLSNVPVVENADLPTMGTDSDNPTATVYGNFKCPVTEGFVFGNLQVIIEEYVETGQLNIEFANLAYNVGSSSTEYITTGDNGSESRMAAVGHGVWDVDPGSYWSFFEEMFAPRIGGVVSYDDVASKASSAGVSNAGAAADRASSGQYDSRIETISATNAVEDGVSWLPTMALAGDSTSPHHGTQGILNWIDARVDSASVESTSVEEEPEEEESEEEPEDESDEEESEQEPEEEEPEEEEPEEEESEEEEPEEEEPEEEESEDESDEEESEQEPEEEEPEDESDEEESEQEPEEEESESDDSDEDVEEVSDTDDDAGDECIIADGILG